MALQSRSGYVYALNHPELAGWTKVGFTRRAPTRRAKELSQTSNPSAFAVSDAQFFWDALSSEQWIHSVLRSECVSDKEFFQVQPDRLAAIFAQAHIREKAGPIRRCVPRSKKMSPDEEEQSWLSDPNWEDTAFGQSDLVEWMVNDCKHSVTKKALDQHELALERRSAQGWGQASLELAEIWMQQAPVSSSLQKARWLFLAAEKQGVPGVGFRLLYWTSQVDPQELKNFWASCVQWQDQLDHPSCPPIVRSTLTQEQNSWLDRPDRAQSWSDWRSARSLPRNPPRACA